MLGRSSGKKGEASRYVDHKSSPICLTAKSHQNIGQFITVKQHQKIWGLSTETLEQKSPGYKWNRFHISNIRKKRGKKAFMEQRKVKGFHLFIFKWPVPCPFSMMFSLALPLDRLGKMLWLSLGGKEKIATCKPLGLGWKSSLQTANGLHLILNERRTSQSQRGTQWVQTQKRTFGARCIYSAPPRCLSLHLQNTLSVSFVLLENKWNFWNWSSRDWNYTTTVILIFNQQKYNYISSLHEMRVFLYLEKHPNLPPPISQVETFRI